MLQCQKDQFSIPENINYLNCAYMGPLLKEVEAIGHQEITKRSQPFLYSGSDFFAPVEALKNSFSTLINANDPQRIAVIASASYGLANAAKNVICSAGQNIIVVGEQFPSNIYPWQQLAEEKDLNLKNCFCTRYFCRSNFSLE